MVNVPVALEWQCRMLYCCKLIGWWDYKNAIILRVTIRAIFTGHVLARISILPKISRFWLFALCKIDRCMTLFDESYKEQSRRLLMLSNRSRGTLVSYNDRCAASSRKNEQTRVRICIALIVLTFSRTTIGRLCTIPACYWSNYFGCFRQYKNPGQDVSRINGTYGHPIHTISPSIG